MGRAWAEATFAAASLVLYVDLLLAGGTVDVYQVNSPWSEGSITWSNAPLLGNKILSAVPITQTGFVSFDVSSTVQAWLNGTLANDGIAVVASPGSSISASFDSKENILTSHFPQLTLVLVSAGPQGAQGPPGPAGSTGPTGRKVRLDRREQQDRQGQRVRVVRRDQQDRKDLKVQLGSQARKGLRDRASPA